MTWLWVTTVAWLIVSLVRLKVCDARTKQALTNCPAKERAAVLEAAGKYARSLGGHERANPLMRLRAGRTKGS